MLRPDDRSLLLESMRPPDGYVLDRAIGTTFTLDLLSLLVTPLAFTFFDWEDREGRPTAEPLALLQALRSNAERIHLFCHAGMINVPPPDKTLLAYLEGSVVEVRPPNKGGLFHPKFWLLRFTAEDEEPVIYRLLCLSRNLTFARSWDTVLVMDGELTDRKLAIAKNKPLGELVEALPGMAIRELSPEAQETVAQMADEVRRVKFEPPDLFDDYAFWPVGLDRTYAWPFPEEGYRFLVMSPFMTEGFLRKLERCGPLRCVISRPESLAQLPPAALESVDECFVMDSGAELDAQEGDAADEHSPADDFRPRDGHPTGHTDAELTGLHAKLFVMDEGFNSRLWTGSANATDAAFANNIEFLVELRGKKRTKIRRLLGDEGDQHTLRALLMPFVPGEPPQEDSEEARSLRNALNTARESLIDLALHAAIDKTDEDAYTITLECGAATRGSNDASKRAHDRARERAERPNDRDDRDDRDDRSGSYWSPPANVVARAWPVTLQVGEELDPAGPTLARFPNLSFEALTAFFAFEVAVAEGHNLHGPDKVHPLRFVLRLPLQGEPADRKERILQSLLCDQDQVMRLLLLLLAGEGISAADFAEAGSDTSAGGGTFGNFATATLLESLLRALDRDPEALDHVHRIITDLRKTPEGEKLIPAGFDDIWNPIWEARHEVRETSGARQTQYGGASPARDGASP